ncbi:hypothetical protein COY87_00365 [Candidatus Roizmanbacteria bacterium CG_4_10_14_0_8_um_filter_33_9]|uniref:Uncharacterized protein n=1 Tax=Candidatus Roizmanbacteria bacterium CG_4_10_14_0_8_um_filter_33_9 TaxID=1974826 RepID=A0A2M7QKL3_9BACT|nr:MAG: hypothetical protein COY87_00365 [Candidatus Roizmanbacteria bacterium CG_4_10_14_0_8_um_filter_33_9]
MGDDGCLDFTKAVIPTFFAVDYLTFPYQVMIVSIMPVIGHLFSIWLRFRGGKELERFLARCLFY